MATLKVMTNPTRNSTTLVFGFVNLKTAWSKGPTNPSNLWILPILTSNEKRKMYLLYHLCMSTKLFGKNEIPSTNFTKWTQVKEIKVRLFWNMVFILLKLGEQIYSRILVVVHIFQITILRRKISLVHQKIAEKGWNYFLDLIGTVWKIKDFLALRFYVKSKWVDLESLNIPFQHI